jgi:hypothetical protein
MLFSISRSFPVSLTRLKLEALSAFVLRMTLSENRYPLFRIVRQTKMPGARPGISFYQLASRRRDEVFII